MEKLLFLTLFIIGALFINASHLPAWFLGGTKPAHQHWKLYAVIGIVIYSFILILANTIL